MPKKKVKSPQQKKALSLAKDRRNVYGETDKGSRKTIPARKAEQNRRIRRKAKQELDVIETAADETSDLVESSLLHNTERVGGWKKMPDAPLGDVLIRKNKR